MRLIKKLVKVLGFAVVAVVGILLLLAALPFILLAKPFSAHAERKREARFQLQKMQLGGGCYFIYTNKKKICDFVQQEVLPLLPADIEIVFIADKQLNTDYDGDFIVCLIAEGRVPGGYPFLMKISKEKVLGKSINNEVYNAMENKGNIQRLDEEIMNFYGLGYS